MYNWCLPASRWLRTGGFTQVKLVENQNALQYSTITKTLPYSRSVHQHNFATWTAARAVARGFISYEHVRDAIELTDLAEKVQENLP